MPANILIPTNAELQRIERVLMAELTMDDPIFSLFPVVTKNAVMVMWEQQESLHGLMPPRGQNGLPQTVKLLGGTRFSMQPGRYGVKVIITETDIENRREWGSFNVPAPNDDLVYEAQDRAMNLRIERIKKNLWDLVTTGVFQVPNEEGGWADQGIYPFQTATASVAWATLATATPFADLRELAKKQRGKSVRFDRSAKMYMNRTTANYFLNNNNSADVGGKRREVGASFLTIDDMNKFCSAADIPEIVVHDAFYLDDSKATQLFIPDNKVVVAGKRPAGQTLGEFQMTRCAANEDGAPGAYTFVTDSAQFGQPVPRIISVDDGFVGGPACFYPEAVCILST